MNRLRTLTLASFAALFLLASAIPAPAKNLKNIHPSGYVTDLAGVISPEVKARLEALCREVEDKTSAEIAVVTVHSLEGESVENFAADLYKQLGVGSKRDSRGVLLLVAPDDHKYRIEVGYGLEPVINDARAGDAGRAMVPLLRQGNYSAAIETATWTLAKYIADERGVTLSGRPPTQRRGSHHSSPIGFWGILFILWIIFSIARAGRGGGRGSSGWWIGPLLGSMGGGWRGGGGFGGSSGGGGFGGFGGGSSGGGGASGSW